MRVLVAIDLSEASEVGLREGLAIASSSADVLAVVHIVPLMQRESLLFPARDASFEARATQLVERANAAVRARVARTAPRSTEVFVDEGSDYAPIVRRAEAWRADVVVVGSHGHSGLSRVLGGVATKVVRHAHCSVLVARASARRGWVLAATDLSEPSLLAVSAAATEARRRGAKLKVVHAVGFFDVEAAYLVAMGTPSIPDGSSELEAMRAVMRDTLTKRGIDAMSDLLDAPPAAAIVRDADAIGAELVVVGTHGRTGLARLALGSVAEKVVRAASCSVLVVRQGPMPQESPQGDPS